MDKRKLAVFAIIGALLSRWHGGGFFSAPKFIMTASFALFPAICLGLMIPNDNVWTWLGWVLFALFVTGTVKATGHGGVYDLGTSEKEPFNGRDLEKIERALYPWAYDMLNRYWYDSLGMALKGLLMSLGVAIPLLVYEPALSIPVILGGIMLAPSYMIGRLFTEKYATEFGEYVGGFFFYLGVYISLTNA